MKPRKKSKEMLLRVTAWNWKQVIKTRASRDEIKLRQDKQYTLLCRATALNFIPSHGDEGDKVNEKERNNVLLRSHLILMRVTPRSEKTQVPESLYATSRLTRTRSLSLRYFQSNWFRYSAENFCDISSRRRRRTLKIPPCENTVSFHGGNRGGGGRRRMSIGRK